MEGLIWTKREKFMPGLVWSVGFGWLIIINEKDGLHKDRKNGGVNGVGLVLRLMSLVFPSGYLNMARSYS